MVSTRLPKLIWTIKFLATRVICLSDIDATSITKSRFSLKVQLDSIYRCSRNDDGRLPPEAVDVSKKKCQYEWAQVLWWWNLRIHRMLKNIYSYFYLYIFRKRIFLKWLKFQDCGRAWNIDLVRYDVCLLLFVPGDGGFSGWRRRGNSTASEASQPASIRSHLSGKWRRTLE